MKQLVQLSAGAAAVAALTAAPALSAPAKSARAKPQSQVQKATVVIDGGYRPAQVNVRAGRPVQLTFVRKETDGCGGELQFPTLGLKRTLPKGGKTVVTFTPKKSGPVRFTCGMEMYKGQVVVR